MEKVVGARTAMSFSVAENAHTCSRKKQRSGLNDALSSGRASGIMPSKLMSHVNGFKDAAVTPEADGDSKLHDAIESIRGGCDKSPLVQDPEESESQRVTTARLPFPDTSPPFS